MAEATQAYHNQAYWVTTVLARYKASSAFKAQWLAQGRRLAELTAGDVRVAADVYLNKHPELFEQAAESIERNRKLRKLAEREARERRAKLSSDAQRQTR
jgi:hypothetical protein